MVRQLKFRFDNTVLFEHILSQLMIFMITSHILGYYISNNNNDMIINKIINFNLQYYRNEVSIDEPLMVYYL